MSAPGMITLANVVATDTTTFLAGTTATRTNLPTSKLEDLTTPKVSVVPMTKQWKRDNRDEAKRTYGVTISVEQRIDASPGTGAKTVDELIALAESIAEWWIDTKIFVTGYADQLGPIQVTCTEAILNADEPFDTDLLRQQTCFRALIGLTFRAT